MGVYHKVRDMHVLGLRTTWFVVKKKEAKEKDSIADALLLRHRKSIS